MSSKTYHEIPQKDQTATTVIENKIPSTSSNIEGILAKLTQGTVKSRRGLHRYAIYYRK